MIFLGKKKAPYLTVFVGGNHEASNYLRELMYGGWVAPKIYYLGYCGIINITKGDISMRLAGISGIFKFYDFHKGYYELLPFERNHIKTLYHTRAFDVFRLLLVRFL